MAATKADRWARYEWRYVVLIALGLLVAYVAMAAGTDLWDRDEPRYARAAVEMWETGDWLVPSLNDEPRLRKPPMIYWMMAPFVGLMGPTELAARMVSVLSMVGAALMTWLCGRRMFGPQVGIGAMAIFGTSMLAIYVGSASIIDAALVFFTTLTIYAFIDAIYRKQAWWHWPVMAVGLCSTVLLKGPLVWPIPVVTILVAGWLLRRELRLSARWWIGFVLLALFSFVPLIAWAIPVDRATGGQLWAIGFEQHVVQRVTSGLEHGSGSTLEYVVQLPLYLPLIVIVFFPWILYLQGAWSAMLGRRLGTGRDRAVLWAWILPWFVFLSLASTKLPHYLMPIIPALAIASAATIALHHRGEAHGRDRFWMTIGVWLALPVAIVGILGALAAPFVLAQPSLFLGEIPVVLVLVAATAWVANHHLAGRYLTAAKGLVCLVPAIVIAMVFLVLPGVEDELKPSADLAAAFREQAEPTTPLFMRDYDEPSLFFYMDRPSGHPIVHLHRADVADWALGRGAFARTAPDEAGLLIIGDGELAAIEARFGDLPVEKTFGKRILDYSSGTHHTEVMLVKRIGP
ncbi:ArnT family glycosyltransferase [Mucisphaera sp.]|uniref:ArnT family glycosyltransferase n=1 Tax=Mucisphaera sp. TaxID=2913024 RepID=UPI003D0DE927